MMTTIDPAAEALQLLDTDDDDGGFGDFAIDSDDEGEGLEDVNDDDDVVVEDVAANPEAAAVAKGGGSGDGGNSAVPAQAVNKDGMDDATNGDSPPAASDGKEAVEGSTKATGVTHKQNIEATPGGGSMSSTVTSLFGSIKSAVVTTASGAAGASAAAAAAASGSEPSTGAATKKTTAETMSHPLQDDGTLPSSASNGGGAGPDGTGPTPPVSATSTSTQVPAPQAASTAAAGAPTDSSAQQQQQQRSLASTFTTGLASTLTRAAHTIQSASDAAWQTAQGSGTQQPGGGGVPVQSTSTPLGPGSSHSVPSSNTPNGTSGGINATTAVQRQHVVREDMDNATKSRLITSALGNLLPGERVIMFLSDLTSVRESGSANSGVGSDGRYDYLGLGGDEKGGNEEYWCAAMTFYRLAIFSYRECDIVRQRPQAAAAAEENNRETMNENPFESNPLDKTVETTSTNVDTDATKSSVTDNAEMNKLMHLIESVSVSRQYQSHHFASNKRKHQVIQIPLGSVDRVEKSAEVILPPSGAGGYPSNSGLGSASSLHGGVVGQGGTLGVGGGQGLGLVIYGKDNGRQIRFATPSYGDAIRAHEALNTYAFPGRRNLGYLFAFESRRAEVMASIQQQQQMQQGGGVPPGQQVTGGARPTRRRFNPMVEFERQGALQNRILSTDTNTALGAGEHNNPGNTILPSPWTPLKINLQYQLCQSYPSLLIGPASVNESKPEGLRLLRQTASFRSERRIPSLSWSSSIDGASIWRCSQPKVGLQGNRSQADERYLRLIAEAALKARGGRNVKINKPPLQFLKMLTGGIDDEELLLDGRNNGCLMKIMDLRPRTSAMANRTGGYGYENVTNYPSTTLSFYNISNIHAIRDSYNRLSTLCLNPTSNDTHWNQHVEDTKWLHHIRYILSASWQCAFHVHYNRLPILIHCSHGWDRTSQVAALAQLFLDGHYRTREGFATLVEKDFMSFGHPLHTRCGHGEGRGERGGGGPGSNSASTGGGGGDEGQIAPIFIQFLDCVYQIVNLFPDYFEFNAKYLLLLSEHVYSCRFGTLLCDTEREREVVAGIRSRTYCLWDYLDGRNDLINFNYNGGGSGGGGVLLMPLPMLLRNVTLWVDRHCMYGPKPTMRCLPFELDSFVRSAYDETQQHSKEEEGGVGAALAVDFVHHPTQLHSQSDYQTVALQCALAEVEKWKSIAEKKQKELDGLKMMNSGGGGDGKTVGEEESGFVSIPPENENDKDDVIGTKKETDRVVFDGDGGEQTVGLVKGE